MKNAVVLGVIVLALAGSAYAQSAPDVQRYNGMASGAWNLAATPSELVLDVAPTQGRWQVRGVSLGEDHVSTTGAGYIRIACWFADSDGMHPFASFRIYSSGAFPTEPFAPPAQMPNWIGEVLPGQVWCGAAEVGATITGGEMWFRFSYQVH